MLRDRRSQRCAEIRAGGGYRRCAVSDALRWDRDRGSRIRVLVLQVSAVGSGQSRFFLGKQGAGAGAGGSRRDWGWDRDRRYRRREEPLRDGCRDRARRCRSRCGGCGAGVAPELRARSCLWPWGARGCRCRARQEDGASLEQTLDRGWKKAGHGDRPAPGPTGGAAPSAPPPAPRGHRAPGPGNPAATALPARIPGEPLPNERGGRWGRLQVCPVWDWRRPEAPERLAAPRVLGICRGGAVPAASCPRHAACQAHGHRGTGTAPARTRLKGCLWLLGQGCSEQAHGDASARTESTDSPEGPEERLARSGNGGTGPLAEGLRQQFLILASKSSHTAARYVLTTPNLFPPFLSEAAVHQQHLS
ncbi:uncharacterized protein LOC121333626 [Onychostruthus taczanowskii]|uniref:uncharacterized protein LOC121333626 n=1 Tax=Onychostruthus taczanowskii TaxID=356909 RepID=UPI001B80E7D9|nr:uncharacterized protein LOC121333626 [Onychostruthus taczanowskii]